MSTNSVHLPHDFMPTVDHSLMPKGVEHAQYDYRTQLEGPVDHSLMPKGVEHITKAKIFDESTTVDHSLMPKGVEH